MSKYRLIKEYPGSPEVGYEIEEKNHWGNWGYFLNCFPLYPEKYPEFWEKVVKKDYEILSFIQESGITDLWTKFDCGWGRNFKGICFTEPYKLEEILNNPLYKIYSVKRLSDGEIFTIGEKTTDGIITKFEILDNVLIVFIFDITWIKLDLIQKAKQPLFTTTDGVDIYKGDIVYPVTAWFEYSSITAGEKTLLLFPNRKFFSTKEKALDYIIMNKPCLSIKDVNLAIGEKYISDILEKLVKDKLCVIKK